MPSGSSIAADGIVKLLEPDWSHYNSQEYSSVKWKIQNLAKLHDNNMEKYQQQLEALQGIVG
jgi:hypothetical protein